MLLRHYQAGLRRGLATESAVQLSSPAGDGIRRRQVAHRLPVGLPGGGGLSPTAQTPQAELQTLPGKGERASKIDARTKLQKMGKETQRTHAEGHE